MSLTYPVTYCRIFSISPSINLLPFVPCPFFPSLRSRKNRRPDDDGIIIGSITVETVLRFLSSGRIRFEKIKRAGYVAASTAFFLSFSFSILFHERGRKRRERRVERIGDSYEELFDSSSFFFRFVKIEQRSFK